MSNKLPYYLDSPSYTEARTVFFDPELKVPASDGMYSIGPYVRQQIGGLLQDANECLCTNNCSATYPSSGGETSVRKLTVSTGSTLGATTIQLTTDTRVTGILAVAKGIGFVNRVVSQNFGVLESGSGLINFLGKTSTAPGCSFAVGAEYILPSYTYYNGAWNNDSSTDSIVITNANQNNLQTSNLGVCTMVIPKTIAEATTIDLYLYSPCVNSTFNLYVSCATLISPISLNKGPFGSSSSVCSAPLSLLVVYPIYVNGSSEGGVALYDMLFTDNKGVNKLADGYYGMPNTYVGPYGWMQVRDGVIIQFGNC